MLSLFTTLAASASQHGVMTIGEHPAASGEDALFAGLATLGGFLIFLWIITLGLLVFGLIAGWKILTKAGQPGWKILIPFYNFYILFKIVKMQNWFWTMLALEILCFGLSFVQIGSAVTSVFSVATPGASSGTAAGLSVVMIVIFVLQCLTALYAFVASLVWYYRLSKAFGHGLGFFFGLIFFQYIFWLILGFGSSDYNKKRLSAPAHKK